MTTPEQTSDDSGLAETGPAQYTVTAISLGANPGTGTFNQYLENSLPPVDSLEDCIALCYFLRPVYLDQMEAGGTPYLIKIESQAGLVVMADIDVVEKPKPVFNLQWRDTLSPSEKKGLEIAMKRQIDQSKRTPFDAWDAAEIEGAVIQTSITRQLLAGASYVEPYRETIKLVYKVEAKLGKSTSKVRDLEESLGL
jgi:hypothetical protein